MKCNYCNKNLSKTNFESFNYKGKTYTRRKCKRCKQDTQNERRTVTYLWYIELKKSMICTKCGNSDYRVLEFHHTENKNRNVSEMMTYSKKKILKEMEKCLVLCANCHRIEHFN